MGQLASKEKNDFVKVAMILDERLEDHVAEDTVPSALTSSTHTLLHNPQKYSLEVDRLAADVDYVNHMYYGTSSDYNITSSSTTLSLKAKANQEKWRKISFSEIVDEEDKKRIEIADIPGLELLPPIGLYSHITHMKINLAHLRFLPPEIGQLKRLVTLDLGQNLLETLPVTIGKLSNLRQLRLSQNKMTHVPPCVPKLTKLETLLLDNNLIGQLPGELSSLVHLVQLNVSGNPISVLPVEISRLADLQKLQTDGCPITRKQLITASNRPMSLREICARIIIRKNVPIASTTPPDLISYITTYNVCSFCKGPYYESYVTRGMQTDRGEGQVLSLEFRLCSEHWSGERSRILTMFSEAPQNIKPLNVIGSLQEDKCGHLDTFYDHLFHPIDNVNEPKHEAQPKKVATLPQRPKSLWPSISHLRKRPQAQELSPSVTSAQSIENGLPSLNCRMPAHILETKTITSPFTARSLTRSLY